MKFSVRKREGEPESVKENLPFASSPQVSIKARTESSRKEESERPFQSPGGQQVPKSVCVHLLLPRHYSLEQNGRQNSQGHTSNTRSYMDIPTGSSMHHTATPAPK